MIQRIHDRTQTDILAERKRQRTELLDKLRRGERVKNEVNVKIKRLHPDAVIPQYATDLAAGFDLVAVEDVIIAAGETAKIPLGLAFEIPAGYVMIVCMRSGIALKTKLRQPNGIGVIDADYRGEVAMMFDNITEPTYDLDYDTDSDGERTDYRLNKSGSAPLDISGNVVHDYVPEGDSYIIRAGDRVAQAFVLPYPRVTFEVVTELAETERGTGGFGSSGVRV